MIYRLANGYSVCTTKVDAGIEFVTTNPEGDTISTTRKTYAEAVPILRQLRVADGLNKLAGAR